MYVCTQYELLDDLNTKIYVGMDNSTIEKQSYNFCNKQLHASVADLGGVRGVQMHPSLAASNVFLCK